MRWEDELDIEAEEETPVPSEEIVETPEVTEEGLPVPLEVPVPVSKKKKDDFSGVNTMNEYNQLSEKEKEEYGI